jgi:hypothetical protein
MSETYLKIFTIDGDINTALKCLKKCKDPEIFFPLCEYFLSIFENNIDILAILAEFSFENGKKRAKKYNKKRKNKTLCLDAISFDYVGYFYENKFPNQIDYLQMDIHPAEDTLKALKAMPLDRYRFSVITYEHNGYINKETQIESQRILKQYGYKLIVENLTLHGEIAYEDWWVDPKVIPESVYGPEITKDVFHNNLFKSDV